METMKQALILAAGFGFRARPLTEIKHKALLPVLNRPLLAYNLDLVRSLGVGEVLINTHHLAEQVEEALPGLADELRLLPLREPKILGTGGAMKNAAGRLYQDPVVVLNGVILTRLDLAVVVREHKARGALATLVLHDRERFNIVSVDPEDNIRGFREDHLPLRPGETHRMLAFTGIHVIDLELLDRLPQGPSDIIEEYMKLIRAGEKVAAYIVPDLPWWKVETVADYLNLHADLFRERAAEPVLAGTGARIDPAAAVEDWAALGPGAKVEAGAVIRRSVLWPGTRVLAGVRVEDSVLTDGSVANRDVTGEVLLA